MCSGSCHMPRPWTQCDSYATPPDRCHWHLHVTDGGTELWEGFPCGLAGKESTCNAGDLGLFPGLGRSPGEEKGYPLQYPGLENTMDCVVHGVTKSRTRLSDFHFHFSGPRGD